MYRPLTNAVPELSFPDEHLDALKRAPDFLLAALKRDGPPIESGVISIGQVDPPLSTALFFFRWISQTNKVVGNINIILSDMRELPENYILLRGSPATRFYLLVRTFFYEFYRFREIFNTFLKAASERGYLSREDVRSARKNFHDMFSEVIEIRNTLVHGFPIWKGQDHFDLIFFSSALEHNAQLVSKETGEVYDISHPLSKVCQKTADTLQAEGIRISAAIQNTIRILVATDKL